VVGRFLTCKVRAQGKEPSKQPKTRAGVFAEVRQAEMGADDRQMADALAVGEIELEAHRRRKIELVAERVQHHRRHRIPPTGKGTEKAHAGEHHRKAQPVVIPAQAGDQRAIRLVEMKITGQLVSRRGVAKAGETLPLGFSEVMGGHSVRNLGVLRRSRHRRRIKAPSFAKFVCESVRFCNEFRMGGGRA
jgi:hypothetical protein